MSEERKKFSKCGEGENVSVEFRVFGKKEIERKKKKFREKKSKFFFFLDENFAKFVFTGWVFL